MLASNCDQLDWHLKKSSVRNDRSCVPTEPVIFLVFNSQTELNQARLIQLAGNYPKGRCVADRDTRITELNTVEDIEELRSEFHIHSVEDTDTLRHREVIVGNSGAPQNAIGTSLVAKCVSSRRNRSSSC